MSNVRIRCGLYVTQRQINQKQNTLYIKGETEERQNSMQWWMPGAETTKRDTMKKNKCRTWSVYKSEWKKDFLNNLFLQFQLYLMKLHHVRVNRYCHDGNWEVSAFNISFPFIPRSFMMDPVECTMETVLWMRSVTSFRRRAINLSSSSMKSLKSQVPLSFCFQPDARL